MGSYSFEGVFDLDEALSMLLPITSPSTSPPTNSSTVDIHRLTASFPAVATPKDAVCSVCTEKFGGNGGGSGRRIPCGHVFHVGCIATWLSVRDSCPLCRVVVVDRKGAHFNR